MSEYSFPTEQVELPSKGLIYPESSPLRSGVVEVRYMSAKEEDILTNENWIKKGIVLDKVLESVIVDKDIKLKNLYPGDKNALLVATRILGYGNNYSFSYKGEEYTINLSEMQNKPFECELTKSGTSTFNLPSNDVCIEFKFLTEGDEAKIDQEIKSLSKISGGNIPSVSTNLKSTIVSIDGDDDKQNIREFVERRLLAQDSRALRKHIKNISPDIDFTFTSNNGEEVIVPINLNFFWPDLENISSI